MKQIYVGSDFQNNQTPRHLDKNVFMPTVITTCSPCNFMCKFDIFACKLSFKYLNKQVHIQHPASMHKCVHKVGMHLYTHLYVLTLGLYPLESQVCNQYAVTHNLVRGDSNMLCVVLYEAQGQRLSDINHPRPVIMPLICTP